MTDGEARTLLKQAVSWGFFLAPKQLATRVLQKVRAQRLGNPEHPGVTRRKDVGAAQVMSTAEQIPKADIQKLLESYRREKGFVRKMKTENPQVWAETEQSVRKFLRKGSS